MLWRRLVARASPRGLASDGGKFALVKQYAWKDAGPRNNIRSGVPEKSMSRIQILGKNPLSWFYDSVRGHGLGQTLTIIWSVAVDMLFDYRYGTDTARRIPRDEIDTESENIVHC